MKSILAGSAPDLEGKGMANPIAQVRAGMEDPQPRMDGWLHPCCLVTVVGADLVCGYDVAIFLCDGGLLLRPPPQNLWEHSGALCLRIVEIDVSAWQDEALLIEQATNAVLENGLRTIDIASGGTVSSTSEMGDAIAKAMTGLYTLREMDDARNKAD